MLAQPTKKNVACRAAAALVLTLVGLCTATKASARITANTTDPVAVVTENGHHVIVTGPIGCSAGERAYLRVTVTQRSTGAVAEGRTRLTCTGDGQRWEVHASTRGMEAFEDGPATAVALARTTDREDTDDAHQWLVDITLVEE
jgi:hypothetical protein